MPANIEVAGVTSVFVGTRYGHDIGAVKDEFEVTEDDGLLDRLSERFYDEFRAAKQTSGKQARAVVEVSLDE